MSARRARQADRETEHYDIDEFGGVFFTEQFTR